MQLKVIAAAVLAGAAAAGPILLAQSKAAPTAADYGRFESLAAQPRGGLSPDGKWLAYGINRSNRDNELRIVAVSGTPAGVKPAGREDRAVRHAGNLLRRFAVGRLQRRHVGEPGGKAAPAEEAGTAQGGHPQPVVRRDDHHRRHRELRVQYQRQPSRAEALRAGAQGTRGRAGADRRRACGRDVDRARARQRTRHDVRQRHRVRLARQERSAGPDDQRRGQDRQRRPALRRAHRLVARPRFLARDLHRPGVARRHG